MSITKKIKELKSGATQGEWATNVWTTGRWQIEPSHDFDETVHPIAEIHPQHNDEQKNNAKLITYLVNNIDKVLEMNRVMGEALKRQAEAYSQYVDNGHSCNSRKKLQGVSDRAKEALNQVKRIEESQC